MERTVLAVIKGGSFIGSTVLTKKSTAASPEGTVEEIAPILSGCCHLFIFDALNQAISEDPDDALHWHQLGIHNLSTQQYKPSQKYLKAAVARLKGCCPAWSNLGISLKLSSEPSQAEAVYKRTLSLAGPDHAHAIFSNLGILYQQQGQYDRAKAMLTKSLEIQPEYAPAFNNLGLVFVAEGHWEEARYYFELALESDPLLDSAKSNSVKAEAVSKLCSTMASCMVRD